MTTLNPAPTGSLLDASKDHKRVIDLPKKRRFQLVRWITLIVVIYVVGVVIDLLVFNSSWNWGLVASYLFSPRILIGVANTLWLTAIALVCGLSLGLIVCAARVSRSSVMRTGALVYIWLVRATPPLVVMLVIYFLGALKPTLGIGLPFLPNLIEWPTNALISPFSAAVIGLSIYVGGKSAEIFRGGYLAVGQGQHEASRALGLSPFVSLTRVTGPQATRILIPPLANEVITMFKNTSLVSVIGFAELLTTTQRIYAVNHETIPMLTVACVWYLSLTSLLMIVQMWLEKKLGRGFNRRSNPNQAGPELDAEQGLSIPMTNAIPLTKAMNKKDGAR